MVRTYNSRQVSIAFGSHNVSAYADDTFVTIEQKGDGVTSKAGCDGEIARAIDPNRQYKIKVSVQQNSPTNKYLQSRYVKDLADGNGMFSVLIKDLSGKLQFNAENCWVVKQPSRAYGKETNNREWELETDGGTIASIG